MKCANNQIIHIVVLDIQVKEPTPESIMKKVKQYLPPRFMSVAQASEQLLNITESDTTNGNLIYNTVLI